MPVRLPLILSQPSRRDVTASELVENVVAAALLVPRLDANLIGDISLIEPGSTDHLCLQGHTREVILAGFMDIDAASQAWGRLGLTGTFIDCQLSADAIRASAAKTVDRRVYFYQLKLSTSVSQLLDRCQELVSAQAVQLVSIGSLTSAAGTGGLPIVNKATTKAPTMHTGGAAHAPAVATPKVAQTGLASSVYASDEDADWREIDKLVDDLDALDI